MEWVKSLPAVNASLNALSTVLLISAYVCIRRRNVAMHKRLMLSACGSSVLFLTSYVIYHSNGLVTKFAGTGWSRPTYFFILATHVPLAALVLPMVLRTLYLALNGRFAQHRRIARWTLPIWLYVSVTGVLVYMFLYEWFPAAG